MNSRLAATALSIAAFALGCGSNGSGNAANNTGNAPGINPGATPALGTAVQLSSDPFIDAVAQHQTAVEPSLFSNGNTLVSAFQIGRIASGASDAVGFATSTDAGNTWTKGIVPGLTTDSGGTNVSVTDAVVAYDSVHSVWMIVSLVFTASNSQLVVSRSSDGVSWGSPVAVSAGTDYDKCWIACDNGATSPYKGTCYTEWDDVTNGQKILMSSSTDGGLTWKTPQGSSDSVTGIAGQIAIQPQGNVVVPFYNFNTSNPEILSISSTNGGGTWSSSAVVSSIQSGSIPVRGETDPTVTTDPNGTIYVAWYDCRFETGCSANDIVMTTSTDGVTWSTVAQISSDSSGSGVNHFLPTISAGSATTLAMMDYSSISAQCSGTTCTITPQLSSSIDGGQTWSPLIPLWPAFPISAVATTPEGPMLGDYFGIAFVGKTAFPAFSAAVLPVQTSLNQQIFTLPSVIP